MRCMQNIYEKVVGTTSPNRLNELTKMTRRDIPRNFLSCLVLKAKVTSNCRGNDEGKYRKTYKDHDLLLLIHKQNTININQQTL